MSFFCFDSCARQQSQPDFYLGLKNKAEGKAEAAEFFEKALNSANMHIRRAAADELAVMMYEGRELSGPVLERIRREASGSWAAAFNALGNTPDKEKALEFLLGTASLNEAALYLMRECKKNDPAFFSETENAAIDGHFAAVRSRFSEVLIFFRIVLGEDSQSAPPEIFLKYPGLLYDLGRAFQYAAAGSEGLDLFLQWEKSLAGGQTPLRFPLLFFAARIARQRGRIEQGISLFRQVLPFAPDAEQADACIWYILDSSLSRGNDVFIQQLEQLIPEWHDEAYFDDVLDKFSRELVLRRDWKKMIHVFGLLQKQDGAVSKAQYAWIIGQAIEEGYLTAEEMRQAAEVLNNAEVSLSVFTRIAYDAGNASFYYRSLSADALGENFLDAPQATGTDGKHNLHGKPQAAGKPSPALEFLLGFFSNNAAGFAVRYINALEKELSAAELRALAEALANAGLYQESMRLVSVYAKREGYMLDRRDMELLYPQPFSELIEQYADETRLDPALLFGLIRTESAFQSGIVSRAGAVGLTQLLPSTAEDMAQRIRRGGGPDYFQTENGKATLDLREPALNIHIGAFYLGYLMERFENTLLALLAYNGGMNRVRRWRAASTLPANLFLETIEFQETREYGRRVMAAAAVYRELYYATLAPAPES